MENYIAQAMYSEIKGQYASLKDPRFGIIGDGSIDETIAIQNAIMSVPIGGTLIVPPGTYKYHWIYCERGDITIIGYGGILLSTFKVENGGDTDPNDSSKGNNIFQLVGSNITLKNLMFRLDSLLDVEDPNNKPTFYSNGHHVRIGTKSSKRTPWAKNLVIDNCDIEGGYGGAIDIFFGENVRVINTKICRTLGNGIFLSTCKQDVTIEDNNISDTRDDGIFVSSDSNLETGTKNVIIRKNVIRNSYAKGIGGSGVDGCIISENYINNTWSACIQVFKDTAYLLLPSKNVTISNNQCHNGGRNFGAGKYKTVVSANNDGIYLSGGVSNVIIDKNRIFTPHRYGVNSAGSSGGNTNIRITRNEINDCQNSAINVGNNADTTFMSGKQYVIEGNKISGCNQGIVIGGVRMTRLKDNAIEGWNNAHNSYAAPIYAKYMKSMVIDGNTFYNTNAGKGINLSSNDADCIIGTNTSFSYFPILTALSFSAGTLSPVFASATLPYSLNGLTNANVNIDVTATFSGTIVVKISINDGERFNVVSGTPLTLPLIVGTNTIGVHVTNDDGYTKYTITAVRP